MKEIKLKAGRYMIPAKIEIIDNRAYLSFPYNKKLLKEIKAMKGRKWHGFDDPPRKVWSFPMNQRNLFALKYLLGKNPYEPFDRPVEKLSFSRPLRQHQREMAEKLYTSGASVWAAEPGLGKTLPALEIAERVKGDVWYVGPKAGVRAVSREIQKWEIRKQIRMFTYNALVKELETMAQTPPQMVIFDESQYIKNPTSQRSRAALHLATAMRAEKKDPYIVLMTGTPAPRTPVDWWHQCEVACPGFLKEGTPILLKKNLSILEEKESPTGGKYLHTVTWLDDENKCAQCGQFKDDHDKSHPFQPSRNEVARLHKRMKGLVQVFFKKDCTDLPDKQYEIIKIKPEVETLQSMKLIRKTVPRAALIANMLRQLSDGFQYEKKPIGKQPCPNCKGEGSVVAKVPTEKIDPLNPFKVGKYTEKEIICDYCGGATEVPKYGKTVKVVRCPKDDQLVEDLENYSSVGRVVIFAAFKATIDKIVEVCQQYGWSVLRVDGRGYEAFGNDAEELLTAMDRGANTAELRERFPKVAFVGHPQAGGVALTLTASPVLINYSNDYSAASRQQSIDRIHRLGMDENRACVIKDYVHLPIDKLVLDNQQKKKKLQDLTLGEIDKYLEGENEV